MHANEREAHDPKDPIPGERRRPARKDKSIPLKHPARKGGFYTYVSHDLLQQVLSLSPLCGIKIEVVIAPKSMTLEEEKEMSEYNAARGRIEESIRIREALEKEEAENKARRTVEAEYQERRAATYAKAVEVGRNRFRGVNVHVEQGGVNS